MKRAIWCGVVLLVVVVMTAGMVGGWMLLRIKQKRDLEMVLPQVSVGSAPLFVEIDAAGAVSVGAGPMREEFDRGDTGRDLPEFRKYISGYVAALRSGEEPLVQIHVAGDARQERVVDVLNVLAGAGIKKVTFTDLIDAEE